MSIEKKVWVVMNSWFGKPVGMIIRPRAVCLSEEDAKTILDGLRGRSPPADLFWIEECWLVSTEHHIQEEENELRPVPDRPDNQGNTDP